MALCVDPLLSLYIWKSFHALHILLPPPPVQPLHLLSSSSLKFAWIAGLLFSDMNVIPDTLGLNCLHFQYRAEQERHKKGGQRQRDMEGHLVWSF